MHASYLFIVYKCMFYLYYTIPCFLLKLAVTVWLIKSVICVLYVICMFVLTQYSTEYIKIFICLAHTQLQCVIDVCFSFVPVANMCLYYYIYLLCQFLFATSLSALQPFGERRPLIWLRHFVTLNLCTYIVRCSLTTVQQ